MTLKSGKSAGEVYIEVSRERESATMVSKLIHDPKMIHNFRQREKSNNESNDDRKESEKLVDLIHTESFVQSVRFHKDAYMHTLLSIICHIYYMI